MTKEKKTHLLPEDLQAIKTSQQATNYSKMLADLATTEHKLMEAEAKNLILGIYLKYGLQSEDQIDPEGQIIYHEVKENK